MANATQQPRKHDGGWPAFRRLLSFWSDFKWHVAGSASLAVLGALIGLVLPWQIGKVVDLLESQDFGDLNREVALFMIAATSAALVSALRRIIAGSMSLGMEQLLRERLFGHLTGLGFRFFDKQQTGQLLSRVTSDVNQVRFFLGYGLIYFFMHATKLLTIPIVLWVIEPRLALIVYIAMPIIFVLSVRFSRRSHPIMRESQQRLALVTAHGEETIVGGRVVRAFGQEEREVDRFRELTDAVVEQERREMVVTAKFRPFYDLIPNITLAVVVLVAALRIEAGTLTLGQFFAFYIYVAQLTGPLRIIGNLLSRAQRATASSERLWELLDADDRIPQQDHPSTLPPRDPAGSELRFEGVTFGYRAGTRVVDDVTLTIPAGSTVALLGPTGCGKTTLASLIPRFYDPEQGHLLLDGVDLRDLSVRELRRTIGLVDQEPFLFSATIRENLRFGREDATDDEVWSAIDAAQAREFVEQLPDSIDTVVGERGLTLSGGQRQRLAIARALVVDPRVLILDDATASVDSQVEARISDALSAAAERRTTIVIAHRPSTIALADHIVIMSDGGIEDQGTHDELIARNHTYQLVHEQRSVRREFLLDTPADEAEGAPVP